MAHRRTSLSSKTFPPPGTLSSRQPPPRSALALSPAPPPLPQCSSSRTPLPPCSDSHSTAPLDPSDTSSDHSSSVCSSNSSANSASTLVNHPPDLSLNSSPPPKPPLPRSNPQVSIRFPFLPHAAYHPPRHSLRERSVLRCLQSLLHWPIDKPLVSTHRLRSRKLCLYSLLALASLSLLRLSIPFPQPLFHPSLLRLLLNPLPRQLDLEHSFRSSDPRPRIPFLLNRFGYEDHPDPSPPKPIPSILHVVPPGRDVFSYIQFLSISSALAQLKPKLVIAHMIRGAVPPPGYNFWFDELRRLNSSAHNPGSTIIRIEEVDDPVEVFGNPVVDVSHKSDVIRMRALRAHGGVYVDTDVIVLRPFDDLTTGQDEILLGVEKADGTTNSPVLVNGVCNAVVISQKDSSFLEHWWSSYKTFEGKPFRGGGVWNYHSVILPWEFAKNALANRTPVTVLDHRAFFTPLWDDPGLKWIHGTLKKPSSGGGDSSQPFIKPDLAAFQSSLLTSGLPVLERGASGEDVEELQDGMKSPDLPGFSLEASGQYAYHMWHHLLEERIAIATDNDLKSIDDLDPIDTLYRDSSFNRVVRKYLNLELLQRWATWKSRNSTHPR